MPIASTKMSGHSYQRGLRSSAREKNTAQHQNEDMSLAMDLAYNLSIRQQSPFLSSNITAKTRRDGSSASSTKSRARKIKAHETEPFLSVDTLPDEKKQFIEETAVRRAGSSPGSHSPNRATPTSTTRPALMSRFSMYSAPSIPIRHGIGSGHRRALLSSSMSNKTAHHAHSKPQSANSHVKMPFKHSLQKPVTPAPPMDRMDSPSQNMKERTAMATHYVNKVLSMEKQNTQGKVKGKLLKAKLKPLYPVYVRGPSIQNCRGIVADAHQYNASPSKTLQRRKQILSSMNAGELKDLMDRPHTVESIHRTSVASSVDEHREMIERHWSPDSFSSKSTVDRTTLPERFQDLNDIVEPSDFATGSPILSREASVTSLVDASNNVHDNASRDTNSRDSTRDTSTVFLTAGRSLEDAEAKAAMGPDVEDASREIIEMADMLQKRISLIGLDPSDLLDAVVRENETRADESSEKEMTSDVNGTQRAIDSRVRPFSASTQPSQPDDSGRIDMRPLSTGDVCRRKPMGSKSVRFADEAETNVSQAWSEKNEKIVENVCSKTAVKESNSIENNKTLNASKDNNGNENAANMSKGEIISEDLNNNGIKGENSSADNVNNNATNEAKPSLSGQSRSACKPSEIEFKSDEHDPDDDKENHAPKKYNSQFNSSDTFTQALASSSSPSSGQSNHGNSSGNCPGDAPSETQRTSFMEEFLAHAAPVDDSECSEDIEDFLQNNGNVVKSSVNNGGSQNTELTPSEVEQARRAFPLMSLSERIANAFRTDVYHEDVQPNVTDENQDIQEESQCTDVEQDLNQQNLETTDAPETRTAYILDGEIIDNPQMLAESGSDAYEHSSCNVPDPALLLTFSSHDAQHYYLVDNLHAKPPVNKNRKKKAKSRRKSESPSRNRRPQSPERSAGSSRLQDSDKEDKKPSKHSTTYKVDTRHHFPSDVLNNTSSDVEPQTRKKKSVSRPHSGSSLKTNSRPNSGSSLKANSRPNSGPTLKQNSRPTVRSQRKDVIQLDLDTENDLEEVDILSYDDLDEQINLIQSELKKNIDQQEMLLSETEVLRKSLKSREGFNSSRNDEDGDDPDTTPVTLPSDTYYQKLLVSYREKCMEVSENCLMISEHITTPRWQIPTNRHSESQDGKPIVESSSETGEPSNDSAPTNSAATESKPASAKYPLKVHTIHESGDVNSTVSAQDCLQSAPGVMEQDLMDEVLPLSKKPENLLRLLCTTIEDVENEATGPSSPTISTGFGSKKSEDLKIVATKKKLSEERSKKMNKPSAPFPPLCFKVNARPPQGHLYYFSYGEHMNKDRMKVYLKQDITTSFWGLLMGFSLVFNKQGEDEEAGGFANIEFNPFCSVEGCLYQLTPHQLSVLDQYVGVPQHYCRVVLPVWMCNSTDPEAVGVAQYCVPAVTYVAQDVWINKDKRVVAGCNAAECVKSADLLTPAYRSHLDKLTTAPVIPPSVA